MSTTQQADRPAARARAVTWGVGALATTAVLLLALEAAHRAGLGPAFAWARTYPLAATANWVLLSALAALALGLVGRPVLALLGLAAPLALMVLVHRAKLGLLGKPLYPWDIFLHREALDLLPEVWRHAGPGVLLAAVLALVGLVALALRVRLPGPSPLVRLGCVVVAGSLLALSLPGLKTKVKPLGLRHRNWAQAENSDQNGLLLAFAFNLNAVAVRRPVSYGAQAVREALPLAPPPPAPLPAPAPPRERPTVIAVMSESFFDPTSLPGVTFSEDPVPTLHRLQAESAAGVLYPPVFGGGTANTEFEFLTGHAMRLLPAGSVPYQQYVRRPHDSLASIFARDGYRTAAVHTYHRWFWERDQVYRHFGFQRFLGLEDLDDAALDGKYVSDSVLTREIVREFEADEAPLFFFGVSMEAHGPYEPGRYPDAGLSVDGPLDEVAKASLLSYAEAARHADRELGALVDYFSRVERPVVLVFFGDHLPMLPEVLAQTGVLASPLALESASNATRSFLHRVPLVMWRNTGAPVGPLGGLSTAFLGPRLLELTGTPGTTYTDFVGRVGREHPIVIPGLVADADGTWREELPASLAERWWTLQYDQLFGDDFLSSEPSKG